MKIKFEKKLSLNKVTVSNLEAGEMGAAKGGAVGTIKCIVSNPCFTDWTCYSCR